MATVSAKPRSGRRRKPEPGPAPRGRRRRRLLAAIEANPGSPAAELGIKPARVHALIAKARAEKLIIKRGKGYGLRG